jgi:hypothetical protein
MEKDLNFQKILLEKIRFYIKAEQSLEFLRNCIQPEVTLDDFAKTLVGCIKAELTSQKLSHIDIKYPANWWEAFKERWFLKWLLKKFPVIYHEEHYDVHAFHPTYILPDEKGVVIKFIPSYEEQTSNNVQTGKKGLALSEIIEKLREFEIELETIVASHVTLDRERKLEELSLELAKFLRGLEEGERANANR